MYIKPISIIGLKVTEISNITAMDKETGKVLFTFDKGYLETEEEYEITNFEDKLLFKIDSQGRMKHV